MSYATHITSTSLCLWSSKKGQWAQTWLPPHLALRSKWAISLKLSGHKMARSASPPATALHFPQRKSWFTACALQSGAVAAPCVWSSIAEEEMTPPPEEVANKEVSPPLRILGASGDCIRESGLACQDSVASRRTPKTKTHHISSKCGSCERDRKQNQGKCRQVWEGTSQPWPWSLHHPTSSASYRF